MQPKYTFLEPFLVFLKLGLTSFGGPVAHLGFFREEIVRKRQWLADDAYADLVALCQFLPGPASSQVGFALGYMRGGLRGALGSWLGFTLPSALIMIACGYSLMYLDTDSGWLHGLKIAAVAVVAQAVWSMAGKLCPDRQRVTLAVVAAGFVLLLGTAWAQVLAIVLGLLAGRLLLKNEAPTADGTFESGSVRGGGFARGCLICFLALLLGLPMLAAVFPGQWLALVDGFYRAGSLVFGGGHVVLPLLEGETVGRGWLDRDSFLAGYGAAQALPGPLFTLAAYLGTVIAPDGMAWLGGVVCLIAILLPSILLVLGVLPYWQKLSHLQSARSALAGANAAVVGILLAALYDPVFTAAVDTATAAVLVIVAYAALHLWKTPPWLLVIACAGGGALML